MTIAEFRIGNLLVCRATPTHNLLWEDFNMEYYVTPASPDQHTVTPFETLQDAVDYCINILLLERTNAMIDSGCLTINPRLITPKGT